MRDKGWVLTKDCMTGKAMQEARPEHIHKFKLFDDDGMLYFEGAMTDRIYNSDGEGIFEPLDYAMGAWGCTELQIVNPKTGQYETI